MKYHCGHSGCDVCGARRCDDVLLEHIGPYLACRPCIEKAVKLAIHVSESFTTFIDPAKPCAAKRFKNTTEDKR